MIQEEALSNASTLDYDALVSDFGDNSQDSSMIPDNESEVSITWRAHDILYRPEKDMINPSYQIYQMKRLI